MRNPVVLIALALGGCAAASSGVLPAGPDTYTLTEKYGSARGGSDQAQRVALTKANDYCAQQGRQFVPNVMSPTVDPNPYMPEGYTVTFRCLAPNDPRLATYQVQSAPNLVIENRNR